MLRDGIRPPISGTETAGVKLTSGKYAIAMGAFPEAGIRRIK
jgi:hypothetical protein